MGWRLMQWMFLGPLVLLGFLVFGALGTLFVQILWNGLLPALFGWPHVSFFQALGLLVLCRILFGGLGLPGPRRSRLRSKFRRRFRQRMAERWQGMDPEERERFRQRMCERWGFDPTGSGSGGAETDRSHQEGESS